MEKRRKALGLRQITPKKYKNEKSNKEEVPKVIKKLTSTRNLSKVSNKEESSKDNKRFPNAKTPSKTSDKGETEKANEKSTCTRTLNKKEGQKKASGSKSETPKKEESKSNNKEELSKTPKVPINLLKVLNNKTPGTDGSSKSEATKDDQSTPKRSTVIIQSPDSPGLETLLCPKKNESPEIEVSWDWGCSQAMKDLVRLKQVKRKAESPIVSPLVSPRVYGPRLRRRMSEEENQARLAFYKNVLAQASKCKEESAKSDSCTEPEEVQRNCVTPKRSMLADYDPVKDLYDDSVNEFMLECSQVIEEQLKNGKIQGSVVSISIPSLNHKPSTFLKPDENISPKRVCHGKPVNLFPETITSNNNEVKMSAMETRSLSLRSPNTARNAYNTGQKLNAGVNLGLIDNKKLNGINQTKENPNRNSVNNKLNCSNKYIKAQEVTGIINNNIIYDSVDKFRKTTTNSCTSNNLKQYGRDTSGVQPQKLSSSKENGAAIVTFDDKVQRRQSNIQEKEIKPVTDLTSFLDFDDYDMMLSSLDFDAICKNLQETQPIRKVCTQKEIEAKRNAALQRLMKKKRR